MLLHDLLEQHPEARGEFEQALAAAAKRGWDAHVQQQRNYSTQNERERRKKRGPEWMAEQAAKRKEKYHSDPEYRARALEYQRKKNAERRKNDPEFRARENARTLKRYHERKAAKRAQA